MGRGTKGIFVTCLMMVFFQLIDTEMITMRGKPQYLDKIKYTKDQDSYYFSGTLYKQANVNIDHQKDSNQKAVSDPVNVDGYPRAYFILDLLKHRLYWFTKKKETFAPHAQSLASLTKNKIYPVLKDEMDREVHLEYNSPDYKGEEAFEDYRKRRFLESNMTRKLFTVATVPVIDQDQIESTIRDDRYLIKGIVVKGYLPNSTEKDGKDIRSLGDPLEQLTASAKKELGAVTKTEFKGINNGVIEKKEGVVKLVGELAKNNNFDLAVSLVNITDPKQKIVIHSNPGDGSYSDMGVKRVFEGSLGDFDEMKKQVTAVEAKELKRSQELSKEEAAEARTIITNAIGTNAVKFVEIKK